MHATKPQQTTQLLRASAIAVLILSLAGCSPNYDEIETLVDEFDVSKSGEILAEELQPAGLSGDAPMTYTLVVDGAGAGADLRSRLEEAGYTPEADPDVVPETRWFYTDADGEQYRVVVKDLKTGDVTMARTPRGDFFTAESPAAVIAFKH